MFYRGYLGVAFVRENFMGEPMSETGSVKPGKFIWISMSRDWTLAEPPRITGHVGSTLDLNPMLWASMRKSFHLLVVRREQGNITHIASQRNMCRYIYIYICVCICSLISY